MILSKFPILRTDVHDISINNYEQRSILATDIDINGTTVLCFCVHLNLLGKDRKTQYEMIKKYILPQVNDSAHIILAGDFNDWNQQASQYLMDIEGIHDAYKALHKDYARTFPVIFPILKLDRIYTRGFNTQQASVLKRNRVENYF